MAMSYAEALKRYEEAGASNAEGKALIAMICQTLSCVHAINPQLVYNQYLTGEVYGYVLEVEGEEDSCFGFYGDDPVTNGMMDNLSAETAEAVRLAVA